MIKFLYTRKYEVIAAADAANTASPANSLLTHARTYTIADKYDMPELRAAALKQYKEAEPEEWARPGYAESIKVVYENTPPQDALQEFVIEAAARHLKQLVAQDDFARLCAERGDIAFELIKTHLATMTSGPTRMCQNSRHPSVPNESKGTANGKGYCNHCYSFSIV